MKVVTPLLVLFAVAGPARAADPTPVRVMSFNIRYGTAKDGENHWDKRKEFLADTITTFDPDLLGTQETLAFQRDFLSVKLPAFTASGVGRDDGKEAGEMAALFFRTARFEKLGGGHFWLSDKPDTPGSKGWDAALPRVATWVKLKDRTAPDAPPVFFLNTHFDHRGTTARAESAKLIRAKISDLGRGCRVVVTGDFNAGEGSDPYTALFGGAAGKPSPLIDTYRTYRPTRIPNEGTFTGFDVSKRDGDRIDWIGCSRDWDVRLAHRDYTAKDGRTPSDHFPVCAVLRAAAPGAKPTIRVLSYNIHHGEGTDGKVDLLRIARVIRAADPDLVALQEVDNNTKRTNRVNQAWELGRLTGLHSTFGKAIIFEGGEYGQALLVRGPFTPPAAHFPLPNDGTREQRIAFTGLVKIDGRELMFATTHLDHQDDALRQKQAAGLNEALAAADGPVILAGDLNATPDSKPLEVLKTKWTVAGKELLTYPSDKPAKQIDYVLTRPAGAFRVVSASVPDEAVASDHRPVLVVFEWAGK